MTLIILAFLSTVSHAAYIGPADTGYFLEAFNSSNVGTGILPSLQCGDYYYSITTPAEPVHYYAINTSMSTSDYSFAVSTCCEEFSIDAANESYHCDNTSLDTVLYSLYEKKGQVNLLSVSDDVEAAYCPLTQKSMISISQFRSDTHIVAVGGYSHEYGAYAIGLLCPTTTTTPAPTEPVGQQDGAASSPQSSGIILPFSIIIAFFVPVFIAWCAMRHSRGSDEVLAANEVELHEFKKTTQTEKETPIDSDDGGNRLGHRNDDDIGAATSAEALFTALSVLETVMLDVDGGHGLDVYQVLAVRVRDVNGDTGICTSFMQAARIMVPILIQLYVTTAIVVYILYALTSSGNFCISEAETDSSLASYVKALCCLLSLGIFVKVGNVFKAAEDFGLYRFCLMAEHANYDRMMQVVPLNMLALRLGQFLNILVTVLSGIGSYLIIFFARDGSFNEDGSLNVAQVLIEVVLNITALFFIAELGQDLVWSKDRNYCRQRLLDIKQRIENKLQDIRSEPNADFAGAVQAQIENNSCSQRIDVVRKVMILISCFGFALLLFCW